MTTQLYTYYDRIACQSEFIFHARNDGDAQRHFIKRFENRKDSHEFQLLHIGSIDHDTTKVTLLDLPEAVEITLAEEKENE